MKYFIQTITINYFEFYNKKKKKTGIWSNKKKKSNKNFCIFFNNLKTTSKLFKFLQLLKSITIFFHEQKRILI